MAEIVVLERNKKSHHARHLIDHFGERLAVEPDWRPAAIEVHQPDLVIAFDETQCERALCTAEMSKQQVATLQIMDGILEWRNTWGRPTSPVHRPINQPALAHKIACLGRADARVLESWGNVGKCEVVGAPRLDRLLALKGTVRRAPRLGRPLRLLVMTARSPGFSTEQIETTLLSLADVRDYLEQKDDIEVIWRLTSALHRSLEVRNTFTESTGAELHEVLQMVDAVITTPSTALLEGMLLDLPVALLDYHNCPHYVPAAWRITCKDQISPTLQDLVKPPIDRMLYQEYCLNDALSCRTPALPRMVALIEEMIRIKRKHDRELEGDLSFPHRILDSPEEFISWPSTEFDLQALYPSHSVFARGDIVAMQAELEAAMGTIDLLKGRVDILTRRLHSIPGYRLAKSIVKRFQTNLA